jgi:hypothetical protein
MRGFKIPRQLASSALPLLHGDTQRCESRETSLASIHVGRSAKPSGHTYDRGAVGWCDMVMVLRLLGCRVVVRWGTGNITEGLTGQVRFTVGH